MSSNFNETRGLVSKASKAIMNYSGEVENGISQMKETLNTGNISYVEKNTLHTKIKECSFICEQTKKFNKHLDLISDWMYSMEKQYKTLLDYTEALSKTFVTREHDNEIDYIPAGDVGIIHRDLNTGYVKYYIPYVCTEGDHLHVKITTSLIEIYQMHVDNLSLYDRQKVLAYPIDMEKVYNIFTVTVTELQQYYNFYPSSVYLKTILSTPVGKLQDPTHELSEQVLRDSLNKARIYRNQFSDLPVNQDLLIKPSNSDGITLS